MQTIRSRNGSLITKKIKTDRKVKHTNYENFQKQILYLLPLLYMQIPSQEDKNIKYLSRIIAIFF